MTCLWAANWVEEKTFKRDGSVTAWEVNPKVHSKFLQLADTERERRASERAKVQKAVEKIRRGRKN
jgi:hypothetical protein